MKGFGRARDDHPRLRHVTPFCSQRDGVIPFSSWKARLKWEKLR